jgi:hypothetical protein
MGCLNPNALANVLGYSDLPILPGSQHLPDLGLIPPNTCCMTGVINILGVVLFRFIGNDHNIGTTEPEDFFQVSAFPSMVGSQKDIYAREILPEISALEK